MDKTKFTWAELVKTVMDEIVDEGAKARDLEKVVLNAAAEKCRQHFNTISLARIATALYKLAELEDELTEENALGDLTK